MKKLIPLLLFPLFLIACNGKQNPPSGGTTSLSLDSVALHLEVGSTYTLTATASEVVTWSSSNTNVASVFEGVVLANAKGECIITAATATQTAYCIVTVTQTVNYGETEHGEYQLIWSDEFDGNTLNEDNWSYQQGGGGFGNNELQYYTNRAENIRVQGGCLEIEARKETYDNREYTSARILTKDKQQFRYGRIEARISLPAGKGTWPAFWMLGNGSWPKNGEIDIMEHVGSQPTMISHAVHTNNKNGLRGNNWSSRYYLDNVEGEFHVYAIEWAPNVEYGHDQIRFYVDNVHTATVSSQYDYEDKDSWPFYNNQYIILNLALGGTMGGTIDDAIFANKIVMKVDYVRVYQKEIY